MQALIKVNGSEYQVDLSNSIDISIPVNSNHDSASAWYVNPPSIEPVRTEQFTGSVREGGSVNFRNIFFNPHGNGTHTECVGHITEEVYSINQHLNQFFFIAELLSITPRKLENGDEVILWEQIESKRSYLYANAIVIRTLPNDKSKLKKQYSNSNPPYVEAKAMKMLIQQGIKHFLIDLPSVDKEVDGGALEAHHTFWEHPKKTNFERTITELVYVPEQIKDGQYLLNLQVASIENDASPSRPILFTLK